MNNFMTTDNLSNLKDNYKTFSIISLVIRIQLIEVRMPFYRGLASSETGITNVAQMPIGNNPLTPKLFAIKQNFQDSPIPPGASGATSDIADANMYVIAQQWRDHPMTKQVRKTYPTSFHWNCPKYAVGRKHDTGIVNADGSDRIYTLMDHVDSNQIIDRIYIFWEDLYRYGFGGGTNATQLKFTVQGQMFIKAQDSTKWTGTQ